MTDLELAYLNACDNDNRWRTRMANQEAAHDEIVRDIEAEVARLWGIIGEADRRIGELRGAVEDYQETVRVRERRAAEVEAKLEAIERTVKSTKGDPEALAAGLACLGVGDA